MTTASPTVAGGSFHPGDFGKLAAVVALIGFLLGFALGPYVQPFLRLV